MWVALLVGLLGAALGALMARRRKGRLLDILQYAASFFLIFAVIGVFVDIFLLRLL